MKRTIYLDNAATTYPKPRTVINSVAKCLKQYGGNPGRGSHKLASAADELVFDCRSAAARMFGAEVNNVAFTLNATHALNLAIKGLVRDGGHILIDSFAHNASYRPVMALVSKGICTCDIYDASDNRKITDNIEGLIRPDTCIIIATHQSNVCSHILPIEKIGRLCAERGIYFIVDASQSAGHIPIDTEKSSITALCMPGHKGLFSPMGTGLLISGKNTEYCTIIEGGAGISSLDTAMPYELPERLEAGTLPLPAIAGLLAGINYINEVGTENIHIHECALSSAFVKGISGIPSVRIYGDTGGSIVSFNIDGINPSEAGAYLSSQGICTRTGYHCAPLAHRTLGSYENGSVRVAFSYMNSFYDVTEAVNAVRKLSDFR